PLLASSTSGSTCISGNGKQKTTKDSEENKAAVVDWMDRVWASPGKLLETAGVWLMGVALGLADYLCKISRWRETMKARQLVASKKGCTFTQTREIPPASNL